MAPDVRGKNFWPQGSRLEGPEGSRGRGNSRQNFLYTKERTGFKRFFQGLLEVFANSMIPGAHFFAICMKRGAVLFEIDKINFFTRVVSGRSAGKNLPFAYS